MSRKMKRVVTWMLVVCLGITGFSLLGVKSVKASDTAMVKSMKVDDYRSGEVFTAPTETGYVFSGWYTDEKCTTALGKTVTGGKAYAKFVPEENPECENPNFSRTHR